MARRPEHSAPPEEFYNEEEAQKYIQRSRLMDIQAQMTERALELLLLPEDESCFLLDIGCGSGLSGSVLEEQGHVWVGVDISLPMLNIALEREVEGDLMLCDMGQGMPFKAGSFDGAVSISALQWLCNKDKASHNPVKRLSQFFTMLYACLSRSARAVFQFYPENNAQVEMITTQATKAGFFGGVVVDYPNSTKAKKMFLVLMTSGAAPLPKGLGDETPNSIRYVNKMTQHKKGKKGSLRHKDWILEKKERRRRQGKDVRDDSKYTGRKRSNRF